MEKRKRTNTIDSLSQQTLAGLDPLLQPFNDPPLQSIPETNINENITPRRFSGILYSLISSLLFTCSNFIIKQLDVVLLDVFLIRFVIQGLISLIFIIYKGYHPFHFNSNSLLIFIRSFIAAIGSLCFYIALSLLPLPDLTTFRYTQIIWTAILALIIFRERITGPTILASALTLIGVVCVAQPSFLFAKSRPLNETSLVLLSKTDEQRYLGMFVAILCAISTSISIVLNKKLLEKNVRQSIVMFHFILCTLTILIITQTYYWAFSKANQQKFDIEKIYLTKSFLIATVLATLQLIPMVLSQKSLKREHPSIVTVIQASDIIFAIILQNIFSNDKSNRLELIGSTLVLTSILIIGIHKFRQADEIK